MGRQKLSSRFGTYTQRDGKVYNRIFSMKALRIKMSQKFGEDWKEKCLSTYGPEQLGM